MTRFVLGLLLLGSPTFAQQSPSPAEMRGAVGAWRSQLESSQRLHTESEIRAAVCNDEIGKLRARLQELEAKLAAEPTK